MKLYLIRHGDALDAMDNPARPLSDAGRAEAHRAGVFLKKIKAKPKFIYFSELLRSAETAGTVAKEMGCVEILEERKGLRPEDRVDAWASELSHVMSDGIIVGHLPFIPALASLLLVDDQELLHFRMSTGSIVCLEREGYGGWVMRFHVPTRLADLFED